MVEASLLGCRVLCPKRLAYPELFKSDALYATEPQLVKALSRFAERPQRMRDARASGMDLKDTVEERVDMNRVGGDDFDAVLKVGDAPPVKREKVEGI
jgi:hypothetical protein